MIEFKIESGYQFSSKNVMGVSLSVLELTSLLVSEISICLIAYDCLSNSRLVCCDLTKASCELIKSVIHAENSPLRELDVSGNWLEKDSFQVLCQGLTHKNCKLKALRSDSSMKAMLICLHKQPQYSYMKLWLMMLLSHYNKFPGEVVLTKTSVPLQH